MYFIRVLVLSLPPHQQSKARRLGIGLALFLRLGLLSGIAWLVGLTMPLFDLGLTGPVDAMSGHPIYETAFSARDIILIAGGLFLGWKATKEIHHNMDVEPRSEEHTSELQSLMRISYAVFCLKKKNEEDQRLHDIQV